MSLQYGKAAAFCLKFCIIKKRICYFPLCQKVDMQIRRYIVAEYPHIHLFWGVALKWQGILQLSRESLLAG